MDVHIPSAITEGLRWLGVDVMTSQEDGTREIDDEALFEKCVGLGRTLFSQDRDILRIAWEWRGSGRTFPGVFFAEQRGPSISRLIHDLELLCRYATEEELTNVVTYLPLP